MEAVRQRRWVCRENGEDLSGCEALAAALGVSGLTARLLLLRGMDTPEKGRQFLDSRLAALPDPYLLPGMERAVERLVPALARGERISVHGDYDVDGITGTALLVETLRAFGAEVDYHIPLRLKDGYGLCADALKKAAQGGARVILTVDCGVSAVAEARLARELGLELIITDHHQPSARLPEATAIVNPHLQENRFPFPDLAGVGVAFLLLVALRRALREGGVFQGQPEPDLRHSLDLVALGTIADIVPLTEVNRTLTKVGLAILNEGTRAGIQALKEVAAVGEITCGVVGFRLAPRLNAAGRLEDAAEGVELLLESSPAGARGKASRLDGFNRERRRIEQETLQQAIARLEDDGTSNLHSIVLADDRWHPGVIGIVASRLVERYHRPTVLIALENGQGKGSARSIQGFHLFRALQKCREELTGFGGHEYAAGLSLTADRVDSFAGAFERIAGEDLTDEDLRPRLSHDGKVRLENLPLSQVREWALLAPFGAGNPQPAFVATDLEVRQPRIVGKDHLRFLVRQDGVSMPCIAFGMAARLEELGERVDLLFVPALNQWQGRTSVQLQIRDFRPATE